MGSMNKFSKLFSAGKIGTRYTKNRIVMSPMGDNMGNPDGSLSEQAFAYYLERAKGGAGVIIPGVLSVDYPTGKTTGCQHRIDDEKFVSGWYRLANAIHHYGALLVPQIHHAGAQTNTLTTEGRTPVCVSDTDDVEHAFIRYYRSFGPQRELTTKEIYELIQKFIHAAELCRKAQCDGVELHAAHGYLISQFLSSDTNKRTDEFGGTLENRMRFAVEIIKGIRESCGRDFIIGARIPGKEWTRKGLTGEECQMIARTFEEAGCDFLDISGGTTNLSSTLMETQGYPQGDRVELAAAIREVVSVPVFTVGNLREPDFCDLVLEDGKADYVCLARALICDPFWPKKAEEGREDEIRKCISCFEGCFANIWNFRPCGCTLNPNAGFEADFDENEKAEVSRKVLVIGGGPGGMQAAITASRRGHRVILVEKEDVLGGQLNIACVPPNKYPIQYATEYLIDELKRLNVDVRTGVTADLSLVRKLSPDWVVAATGSVPATPPFPGVEHTIQAWDILNSRAVMPESQTVTIIGGGIVGCETALLLARQGYNDITILEMLPSIANDLEATHLEDLMKDFAAYGVKTITNAAVKSVDRVKITYEKNGRTEPLACEYPVLAIGQEVYNPQFIEELMRDGCRVSVIGDAVRPRKIIDAIREGNFAAYQIR